MSSFAGISVIDVNNGCSSSGSHAGAGASSGYHLLVIKGYSASKRELATGESMTTQPFMVGGHDWSIDFYPNGENPSCADFISLNLSRLYDDEEAEEGVGVEAKFSFSLVDEVEKQTPMYISQIITQTNDFSRRDPCWGCDEFVTRDFLERSDSLKHDCFIVRCDIVVCKDTTLDASGTGTRVPLPDIHQHFSHLLQSKVGADVTFEVGGKTFAAHRCVLAARSQVFMAQLFGPMSEGTTTSNGVIHIKDMEAKVFRALLHFIYTDSFPVMEKDIVSMEGDEMPRVVEQGQAENKMPESVEQTQEEAVEQQMRLRWLQDLFVAADRYDLQRLKFICEKQLSEHMCVSSVASTLLLSKQHHSDGLKEACLKFIQVLSPLRLQTLMATTGWGHVATTYPTVLYELIAMLAANQRK